MNVMDEVHLTNSPVVFYVDRSTGRPFQQNHCGSILQHLTLDLPDGSSDIWFASTASFIQGVENYLPTPSNELSPTFLMESELSSCPFPIYTHRQSAGDLLILPPSWYVLGPRTIQIIDRLQQLRSKPAGGGAAFNILVARHSPQFGVVHISRLADV